MQTPFADKLYTNYAPSGAEVDQIHQVIAKPLNDISQLTEKIACLQAIIDDLSRERDELSRFVEDHRALLSGARRLPHELVQEIFMWCLPNDRNPVMSSDEAPILLGRICKLWRQISLSTPQLWSSLHVPTPECTFLVKHGREKLFQRGAAVKAWLERSGSCLLSLSLTSEFNVDPQEDEESSFAAKYLLRTIIDFSERWQDVDFTLSLSVYEECFSTLAEADVPVLERIRFQPFLLQSSIVQNWDPSPMFRIPSLHHVTLFSVDYTTSFVLHWECITHLSLSTYHWSGVGLPAITALEILNQCSKLISCKMEVTSDNRRSPLIVTLPFLVSLEVIQRDQVDQGGAYFFEALSLPRLRHFKYSGFAFFPPGGEIPFSSIIKRPQSSTIESFELRSWTTISDGLMSECLLLLPSLKRLTVFETSFSWGIPDTIYRTLNNDFLTSLTPSADSGECLCPDLEEISLEECIAITDDAICPFLIARTRGKYLQLGVVRLKRAKFSFKRQQTTDVSPELTPLREEGLHVLLDYTPSIASEGPCSPRRGINRTDMAFI
jgi:hypothetical protein